MERTQSERVESDQGADGAFRFGVLYAAIYAVALLPPFYIALSRRHSLIAGIPESIWYLLLVSVAPVAVTYGLWRLENRRGDLV